MTQSKRLEGKTALITGANRGIGKAIALSYAHQGANVGMVARNEEQLKSAAEEVRQLGGKVFFEKGDITDAEGMEAVFDHLENNLGPLDILVNNAGIHRLSGFMEYTPESWREMVEINLNGTFISTQAALRRMMPRKSGKIVMIASTAGKYGSVLQAAYNSSKHGVVGLTKCLALETASYGIRVNAICPGFVDTEMVENASDDLVRLTGLENKEQALSVFLQKIPIGRILKPEDIAHLAIYLGSDESDGMTGQAITISGGMLLV